MGRGLKGAEGYGRQKEAVIPLELNEATCRDRNALQNADERRVLCVAPLGVH